ncbi:MAG: MFS transporter [Spirochaetales bacterium]|nr:MFS transporter [Spirochaetales bacterium]MBQ3829616.1 MFS transporter [Spirochaetales bacterium]MBQ7281320.1 MFS transporter [Spirochaetales bacterium]MBQ7729479.1 MFS transporter [Spirochaetales bacterium]
MLKLNKKRTFLIGFAFFGILLLWQVYDSWCPTLLTEIIKTKLGTADELEVQWLVGIIMACDNLAALILLPIFGSLSDKTHTRIGKRMPYILVGTFVSAIAFPFIPLFFHLNKIGAMIAMMAIVLLFMMMYRNPAVALMPDITPKPLRAKANGIINIMGYFGGAFATVLGMVFVLSKYLKGEHNLMTIELPFVIASVLMVISALVLFFTVRENKIEEEIKDELEEGERMAAIADPVDDNKPMSKANRIMLFAILGAEFLWFMSDNALGTYLNNYVFYAMGAATSNTSMMVIAGGLASVIGFATAGFIADKIGRKWTISAGLSLTVLGLILMCFIKASTTVLDSGLKAFPKLLLVVWIIKGYGMALVHNCSFPMVVELCSSKKIGKFTGYYYASSMAAQTVTPVLLGLILRASGAWRVLPIYATILTIASCLVFTSCVKNIKAKKMANAKGLEALANED